MQMYSKSPDWFIRYRQTFRFWLKFGSLSPALTLEIRSRSPNLISSSSHPIVLSMQIWLKSAGWSMRRCARKKLSCQRRRDPYQKQYVSLPFGGGGGGGAGMIMQRTIFSLERLCSKTAPKYWPVSLASISVPYIEEFKADLDKVPGTSTSWWRSERYDRSYLVTSSLRPRA